MLRTFLGVSDSWKNNWLLHLKYQLLSSTFNSVLFQTTTQTLHNIAFNKWNGVRYKVGKPVMWKTESQTLASSLSNKLLKTIFCKKKKKKKNGNMRHFSKKKKKTKPPLTLSFCAVPVTKAGVLIVADPDESKIWTLPTHTTHTVWNFAFSLYHVIT